MAKRVELLDEVLGRLQQRRRRRWIDTVSEELRGELCPIKEQFRGGQMGGVTTTGLSELLAETLAARGVQVHPSTLCRWLKD